MSNHLNVSLFLPLPIEEWQDSKNTLHLYLQNMYNDMRSVPTLKNAFLDLPESVYLAGAKRAHWDIEEFRLPVY